MLNSGPYRIIPCKRETIESLHKNIDSLISFLGNTPPHRYQTTKILEANIRDVGYKAEDILESYIIKHSRSIYKICKIEGDDDDDGTIEVVETDGDDETYEDDENVNMLSQSLVEVMKGFESLMEEMKEIQSNVNFLGGVPVEQMTSLSLAAGSSKPTSSAKNKFVLLDEDLMNQIKEQLFYGESRLKVIPIVGMGGIGKTTLAKALIDDPFTSSHFDVRGWVTVSQQYSIKDVVENLLKDIKVDLKKKMNDNQVTDHLNAEDDSQENQSESRQQLHKTFYGRRYIVVLDDLWDTQACDELLNLFPDWSNGSRIMVTTRQSRVATFAAKSYHEMNLLNDDKSWNLLSQEVFPQEGNMNCPMELMEIGKEIAIKCKGLPLTISVIGGLLSKGEMTQEHWKHIADNMKSVLTEEGDWCSKILSLSYNHLPHPLKACFLYFGIYPEDFKIPVSELLQFWVVEGFLKPASPTDMEKVAEENLKELIKRNLVLVHKVTSHGKPLKCKIHDLLRDLCIREARKEKFFCVWNEQTEFNHEETKGYRRLSILPGNAEEEEEEYKSDKAISMQPGIRSLICFGHHIHFELNGLELLRVFKEHRFKFYDDSNLYNELSELANLKWIKIANLTTKLASSIFNINMWDLQYLYLRESYHDPLPLSFWCMPQLRHLMVTAVEQCVGLPPPLDLKRPCILSQLEVLSKLKNFRCDDEFPLRIPNLKELNIEYNDERGAMEMSYYLLNNLVNMLKLEILTCGFYSVRITAKHISFPNSLKRLTLIGSNISWEHIDQVLGVLPNLEFLELNRAFVGPTWETNEDHFKKLEFLMIDLCDLQEWIVEDSNHFPSLRVLYIGCCYELEEIPTCIGEIQTLERLEIKWCPDVIVSSAKAIQDDYNNDIELVLDGKERYAYEEEDEE